MRWVAALAGLFVASPSWACGGFFCKPGNLCKNQHYGQENLWRRLADEL